MARPDEIGKSSWMSTLASTAVVIAALYMAISSPTSAADQLRRLWEF